MSTNTSQLLNRDPVVSDSLSPESELGSGNLSCSIFSPSHIYGDRVLAISLVLLRRTQRWPSLPKKDVPALSNRVSMVSRWSTCMPSAGFTLSR